MSYTVSVRDKGASQPILSYLFETFDLPLSEIDSVFGFRRYIPLYGGRIFERPQLSDQDISDLHLNGIGYRMPLTNHYVTIDDYEKSRFFLDKFYHPLNSVICVNDDLARWVRRDYPKFKIEASVIKNLNTLDKVKKALELYDSVVPPINMNDDKDFLESLPKDSIRLFVNAFCAYKCPAKICYPSISKINKGQRVKFEC